MTTESEPFLQRWSKRKRAAQQTANDAPIISPNIVEEERALSAQSSPVSPVSPDSPDPNSNPPEKPLTDADMPPLDTLTPQTDMQPFFSPAVSEELRQEAFRTLFRQAKFNQCDGMDIYARNYNDFKPLGDIIPHDMQRFLAREAQAAAEREHAQILSNTTETSEKTTIINEIEPAKTDIDVDIDTDIETKNKA